MKTKIIKKKKLKSWIYFAILGLFVLIFSFCTYKLVKYLVDSYNTKRLTNSINESTEIIEVNNSDNSININPPEDEKDDYWDFIKQPFVSVNFDTLKERNSDTVAWIYLNNTNINYPVVQTDNNDYYLRHAFDKSWSGGGWIYMDYRNNSNDFGTNTIIYGHSMRDKSMFGTLLNARYEWWYTNKDNQVIKMSTPTQNTLWRIFSIYAVNSEGYYITTDFSGNNEIQRFFNTLKERSKYDFGVDLIATDKILTLSTCNTSNGEERLVVHAKLISTEAR